MRIIVLGSGAGGGVPQWNCRCSVCSLAWEGDARVPRRSQSSLAVSADDEDFFLINASPDLRQQILETEALRPRLARRDSPLRAVVITSLDVDNVAGLLTLRERQPFALYATASTLAMLAANPIFDVLARDVVERKAVALDVPFEPVPNIACTLFATPGKVALWQEGDSVEIGGESEATVGVELRAHGKRVIYAPACASVSGALLARTEGADVLFFDGTTFTDDELPAQGLMHKTAGRMGHVAMSGEAGSLEAFAGAKIASKVYIHINNSNPALIAGSAARAEVEAAGWTVGFDGMEVLL